MADLPPRTYDAYLDAAWDPQINAWLGAELDVRIGTYSDFARVNDVILLYTGKAEAVLAFSPCVKIKAGVWYLDRNVVKMLPAGGVCWTPNPDVYFNFLFPNPKVGRRLTTWGTTDWWIYASGDYGGGGGESNAPIHPRGTGQFTSSTTTTFALPWAWSSTRCGSCAACSRRASRSIGRSSTRTAQPPPFIRTPQYISAPGFPTRSMPHDECPVPPSSLSRGLHCGTAAPLCD